MVLLGELRQPTLWALGVIVRQNAWNRMALMKLIAAFLLSVAFLACALLVWKIELVNGFTFDRSGKAFVAMIGFGTIFFVYSIRTYIKNRKAD